MKPGCIEGANVMLGKPPSVSDDECSPLHIKFVEYENGMVGMTSAWFPSPREVQAMIDGEPVYVTVMGMQHPMIAVGVKGVAE